MRGYIGEFHTGEGESDWYLFSADSRSDRRLGGRVMRGKHSLYSSGVLIYTGLSTDEMAGRLLRVVRDRLTGNAHEFVQVSGAGAVFRGNALLMPSAPNQHLPLLAALLVRAGADYLGDEIVPVDPVLHEVHPVPLPLLIDTDDIPLVPGLARPPVQKLRSMEQPKEPMTNRRPVTLGQLGGRAGNPAPVRWIVFPSFDPGARTELLPMGKSEAVFRLTTESVLNLDIWRERALLLARDLIDDAAVARLVVGSADEAVDLLTASLDLLPAASPS